ncbi:MAG: hypothetical protein ACHREM_15455 [Polyangiales bacterium]
MGQKRTPKLVSIAKRLRREGRSHEAIAEILSRDGKSISKASVINWLGDSKKSAKRADPTAPTAPSLPVEPVDESEMTSAEFTTWLGTELRRARAAADACRANVDGVGTGRAMRLAAQLAALMQKQQARTADDGAVVRVNASDVRSAAERARSKMHDLVARLSGERDAIPACPTCGGPDRRRA